MPLTRLCWRIAKKGRAKRWPVRRGPIYRARGAGWGQRRPIRQQDLTRVGFFTVLAVIILGYSFNWSWTGPHGRTLYDWLQLLIIPAVLAVGGYLFNYATTRAEQRNTQLRDQTEQEIASDNQGETALQAYIDH